MFNRSIRARSLRTFHGIAALCDPLEPRLFLSSTPTGPIDIAPTAAAIKKLATDIVAGTTVKGSLKVTVADQTSSASGKAPIPLSAFLRLNGTGDNIDITPKDAKVSNIAGDKTKSANLQLVIPANLPAGTYTLVVVADPNNTFAETNDTNNTLVINTLITIAAPFIDLDGSLASSKLPDSITAGASKGGALQLALSNAGNIAASGAVSVTLALRPVAGGSDIPLGTSSAKLPTVKPDGDKNFKLAVTLPASLTSQLTPGDDYTLLITITPSAGVPLTITGPTFTITAGNTPTPPANSAIFSHGDTITFTADTHLDGTSFLEMGSFVTNTGATGSYRFTPLGLALTYNKAGDIDAVATTFTTDFGFLDPTLDGVGQKITFSFDPTGAFITIPNRGPTATQTAYGKYS